MNIRIEQSIDFELAEEILSDREEVFFDYEWEESGAVGPNQELSGQRTAVSGEDAVQYLRHLRGIDEDGRYIEAPEELPAVPGQAPIELNADFSYMQAGPEKGKLAYEITVFGSREELQHDGQVPLLNFNGYLGQRISGPEARKQVEEYVEVPF